jgi:hypothetical protein
MNVCIVILVTVGDDVSPEEAKIRARDVAATMIDATRTHARQVHGAELKIIEPDSIAPSPEVSAALLSDWAKRHG